MNKVLRVFLEVYRLAKSAERQLKERREALEEDYPKGSEQLAKDSGGELSWESEGEEVNVEALPASVRKAVRQITFPVGKLRAYLKLNGEKHRAEGVDTSVWFRQAGGWSLKVKPEGKA